jgi:broad specificity phosphatase PhoE
MQVQKTDLRAIGQAQHAAKAAEAKAQFVKPDQVKASLWEKSHGDSWRASSNTKLVHFVRHGQGYHNLLGEVTRDLGATFSETGDYELAVKENCPYLLPGIHDPPLTSIGREDAKRLKNLADSLHTELYVVSPMKRSTQTILIGFREDMQQRPKIPVIAHEGCREQCGVFLCDKRSSVTDCKDEYPLVDFSLVEGEEDILWQTRTRESMLQMAWRADEFLTWLHDRPEREIVVGTHSAWLMALYNVALEVEAGSESLQTMFYTGELRSTLLTYSPNVVPNSPRK